jgi:hypothetical protein
MAVPPIHSIAAAIWPVDDHAHLKRTDEERLKINVLRARDHQVHANEQAHLATAGGRAWVAGHACQVGPDGEPYAIAVEVDITVLPETTPEDRYATGQPIERAAVSAPEPTPQDEAAAARAAKMIGEAETATQKAAQDRRSEQDSSVNTFA